MNKNAHCVNEDDPNYYFDNPGYPVHDAADQTSVPVLAEAPFVVPALAEAPLSSADQRPPVRDAADQRPPVRDAADQRPPVHVAADQRPPVRDAVQETPEPPFLTALRSGNIDEYLNPVDFCVFLAWLGYRRYLAGGSCEVVLPQGGVLQRVDLLKAKEDVERYIQNEDLIQGVKDKVFRKTREFFKAINLTSLPEFTGQFLRDDARTCWILYLNCAVKVTAQRIERVEYGQLDKYVWKEDIIRRWYAYDPDWRSGIYHQFTRNQCSDPLNKDAQGRPICDEARHTAYLCSIGYNLHRFKTQMQPCLTIYSDSMDGDRERNGGSGKSMIIQLLRAMQTPSAASGDRLVMETGENLRSDYAHNFDQVTSHTRVVVIDDLNNKRFRLSDLYSWVSTGMKINKKGKESISLPYEDSPKCVITSNNPVSGTRDSDVRRRMDVQLHRYYNARHKPIHDFGRAFFNEDFTDRDWKQFDCFALHCVQLSLRHQVAIQGLPPYANTVLASSLELEIGDDLVEYLDAVVSPGLEASGASKLDAKALKNSYEEEYKVRRKESAKRFNQRLRRYAELRGLSVEFRPVGGVNWCHWTGKPHLGET